MKNITEKFDLSSSFAEVGLRYDSVRGSSLEVKITTPYAARELLMSIWNRDTLELREEFYVLLLNNAKQCLGWSRVSVGGKTATIVEVSQVVTLALLGNAKSLVVAHNHPSGILKPSRADINLTTKLATALQFHDLELSDHLIITREDYYSFREHDLIHINDLFL